MKRLLVSAAASALVLTISATQAIAQPSDSTAKPTVENVQDKKIDPNQVVAKVGNQSVRLLDVMEVIRRLPQQLQQAPLEQLYPHALQQMVTRLAVVKKAREGKLNETHEFKKLQQELVDNLLQEMFLFKDLKESLSEDELQAEFDQYKKEFVVEDQVKARHLLFKEKAEAEAAIKELGNKADFAKLAEKSLDQASARNGGDLGFFGKNDLIPEFTKAAFALKDGEFTKEAIKTSFGYHVIMRESGRKTEPLTYEKAKASLLPNRLRQKEIQARLKKAMDGLKVEMFNMDGTPLNLEELKNKALGQPGSAPATVNEATPSEDKSTDAGENLGKEAGKALKK